jgi:hypothetical protein
MKWVVMRNIEGEGKERYEAGTLGGAGWTPNLGWGWMNRSEQVSQLLFNPSAVSGHGQPRGNSFRWLFWENKITWEAQFQGGQLKNVPGSVLDVETFLSFRPHIFFEFLAYYSNPVVIPFDQLSSHFFLYLI